MSIYVNEVIRLCQPQIHVIIIVGRRLDHIELFCAESGSLAKVCIPPRLFEWDGEGGSVRC